jgi:hypothetical protein
MSVGGYYIMASNAKNMWLQGTTQEAVGSKRRLADYPESGSKVSGIQFVAPKRSKISSTHIPGHRKVVKRRQENCDSEGSGGSGESGVDDTIEDGESSGKYIRVVHPTERTGPMTETQINLSIVSGLSVLDAQIPDLHRHFTVGKFRHIN